MDAEADKLDINKLANVPTGLNNLKTKVDDVDVDKLKAVPVYLESLSNIVNKGDVMKTVYNKANTKVNDLKNKILSATALIHKKIIQYR